MPAKAKAADTDDPEADTRDVEVEPQVATTMYAPNQQCVHTADGLGPALVHSSGATAGIPGSWTPASSMPPVSVSDLQRALPIPITASPGTTWTVGQYVQTGTTGVNGRAYWHVTNGWVAGAAP